MNKELSKVLGRLQKINPTIIQDVNETGVIKRIPLDSPQMTYLFSGGLPIGRLHRFRGPESAGKSTICNYLCGQIQKNSDGILKPEQNVIVYLDYERTFDKKHAEENGLLCDEDHFIYMRPDNIEDSIDALSQLIPTGTLAAIVLDSDAAAPSKAQMINEGGKACVAPNTLVEFFIDDYMTGTIAELFMIAGYEDYKSMPINEFVKPKKKIYISSIEDGIKTKKLVTNLIYKGESNGGYKIISSRGIFLATGDHLLFENSVNSFIPCKDAYKMDKFIGLNQDGDPENVIIEKVGDSFSILDLEVEDTHTYFSAGILSHNTFGGSARALGEMVRKFNILCANYNTTMFWISQERANMQFGAHLPAVTGGFAPNFYASTINRVTKKDTITKDGEVIGISIRVRNYKNKVGVCFRDANMNLYFKGGFNTDEEYLDFMISLGVIKQGGAWFTNDTYNMKINGKTKVAEWLKENPDAYKKLREETNEKLMHQNELDVNNSDPSKDGSEVIDDDDEILDDILVQSETGEDES